MFNKQAYQFYEATTEKVKLVHESVRACGIFKDVKLLGYNKVFEDCSYIYIDNGFNEYFKKYCDVIKDRGAYFINAIQNTSINRPHIMIWPQAKDNSILSLLSEHNIAYGLSILFRVSDGVETISFAGDQNSYNLQSTLVNNLEQLSKFVNYFRQQISLIISNCDKKDYGIYSNSFDINFKSYVNEAQLPPTMGKSDELYLSSRDKHIKLSLRETQCVNLISKGFTAKGIGKILNISPRTVESYLNNIKSRVSVNSKNSLIELYYDAINKANLSRVPWLSTIT